MRLTNTVILVGGPYHGEFIDVVNMRQQIHMPSKILTANKEVYQLLEMNFMNETGEINTYFYAYAKEVDDIEMDDFLHALTSAYSSGLGEPISHVFLRVRQGG